MTSGIRRRPWRGPALPWHNLTQNKVRLAVAVSSISFASALMFLQIGLLGAVKKSASLIYDTLDFDIVLLSSKSLEASFSNPFDQRILYQAAGAQGVAAVTPIYISFGPWRNPTSQENWGIMILGFKPQDSVFRNPELSDASTQLQRQDTVLINQFSRPEFGDRSLGIRTELRGRVVEIVGQFRLSNTLRANGTVLTSDQNFSRLHPGRSLDAINLGLIKLESGADGDAVLATLREKLPLNVNILSRQEAIAKDQTYWVNTTSTGFVISVGAVMAVLVGGVIVYQVLHADVSEHLQEYAVLKAIGFSNQRLFNIVLQEAVILALLGFVPGLLISFGLYQLIWISTRLPIAMTLGRVGLIFGLSLTMCGTSGCWAARRIFTADPANVF